MPQPPNSVPTGFQQIFHLFSPLSKRLPRFQSVSSQKFGRGHFAFSGGFEFCDESCEGNFYQDKAVRKISKIKPLLVERGTKPESNMQSDCVDDGMPFTGHDPKQLQEILKSIIESGMPVEIFDAFLGEYVKTKDLNKARFFAMCEWDC